MTTHALEITNLRKRYAKKVAVDDLSLTVDLAITAYLETGS